MKNKSILLQRGQRGIIVGQTGSGKTIGAIWQLQQSALSPVIILDTKGEPAFNKIARGETEPGAGDAERLEIYDDGETFLKAWKRRDQPEYIIVRPSAEEIAEPLAMDLILTGIYNAGKSCLVYIDEAYQWHIAGRAGPGLVGLLTRGRSKGMTTLISTQRPAWISRFCFSEAQKFYIYRLSDKRDMKTLAEYIHDFSNKTVAKKHHFWYYNVDMEACLSYRPVPLPDLPEQVIDLRDKWL